MANDSPRPPFPSGSDFTLEQRADFTEARLQALELHAVSMKGIVARHSGILERLGEPPDPLGGSEGSGIWAYMIRIDRRLVAAEEERKRRAALEEAELRAKREEARHAREEAREEAKAQARRQWVIGTMITITGLAFTAATFVTNCSAKPGVLAPAKANP